MADKVVPGPVEGSAAVREAVCIHTRKIFDACRDKDCVEDLRVYPTVSSQTKLDSALSVRPRSAELLCADVRVKEITFNKGYYTVDVTYFYRVRGETFPGLRAGERPCDLRQARHALRQSGEREDVRLRRRRLCAVRGGAAGRCGRIG